MGFDCPSTCMEQALGKVDAAKTINFNKKLGCGKE